MKKRAPVAADVEPVGGADWLDRDGDFIVQQITASTRKADATLALLDAIDSMRALFDLQLQDAASHGERDTARQLRFERALKRARRAVRVIAQEEE